MGLLDTATGLLGDIRPGNSGTKSGGDRVVEFIAKDEYVGALPEPAPSHKCMPDWFRDLPPYYSEEGGLSGERPGIQSRTVKGCMPFLEALTLGWTLPNICEVHTKVDQGEVQVDYNVDIWGKDYIAPHPAEQLSGYGLSADTAVLKFNTPWYAKAPPGSRVLMTDPMNRSCEYMSAFSGVRHADRLLYRLFVLVEYDVSSGTDRVVPDGHPLAQMIFFDGEGLLNEGVVRAMTESEELEAKRVQNRMSSHESHYRHDLWEPLKASRNIDTPEQTSSCPFDT